MIVPVRTGHLPRGLGDGERRGATGQAAGPHRCLERLHQNLARESWIRVLQTHRRLEQQRRRLAAAAIGEPDYALHSHRLSAQRRVAQVRQALVQQRLRPVGGPCHQLRMRSEQQPQRPPLRLRRQLRRTLEQGSGCGTTAAFLRPAS